MLYYINNVCYTLDKYRNIKEVHSGKKKPSLVDL